MTFSIAVPLRPDVCTAAACYLVGYAVHVDGTTVVDGDADDGDACDAFAGWLMVALASSARLASLASSSSSSSSSVRLASSNLAAVS